MLPNYLAQIKSSGIYRFVWDKSEIPGPEAEILRLVIGYSEKGPFNTPVYVKNEDEFKKIFGGKSRKMERYGMWFHRSAIQALKGGPILAFNLKNFEDAPEGTNEVEYTTFNPSETIFNLDEEKHIIDNLRMTVKQLYNTDRFWTLEPEHLEELEIDGILPTNKTPGYITITTTDSKDTSVTIFMRGYEPKGFDVPIAEWYSSVLNGEEVPSYLEGHERDLVSQFFAEIFIFRGEFTPEVAASDKLSKFFNVNGNEVTLKPFITNAFGEKLDTLTALAANDASNFIKSYSGILLPDFRNGNNTVISLDAQVNGDNYIHKLMMRLNQDMLYSIDPEGTGFQISNIDTTGWHEGPNINPLSRIMSLDGVSPIIFTATFEEGQWNYDQGEHQGESADYYKYEGLTPSSFSADGYTAIFNDDENKFGSTGITEGDVMYMDGAENPLSHVVKIDIPVDQKVTKYKFSNDFPTDRTDAVDAAHAAVTPETETTYIYNEQSFTTQEEAFAAAEADIEEVEVNTYNVTFDNVITDVTTIYKCISSVTATSTNLKPLYLKGYTYGNPKPVSTRQNDKLDWQHYQLAALTNYKGIRQALTNRVDIQYRYLVDTYEGFVEANCKGALSNICMEKDNTLGILNFPALASFSKCKYVSFRNEKNEFDTKYIPQGGNSIKPMSCVFTLPSQEDGASWVGFFTCLKVKDVDTGIKEIIPSAALVSNEYMKKFSTYLPYTIIAGSNRGVVREQGLIGPDFNFSREDLDNLEPFGVNCMVYVDRKGTVINSEQTAKQNPVTTLSNIHVRELVIFLQDEIEKLLNDYHWDFNTPNLQQTIKDRADVILETCKNNDGIYDYLNVCDSSNNTDDVINNSMFILSTSIEPTMGAGKMVQELTIYRKGGMKAVLKSDTGA